MDSPLPCFEDRLREEMARADASNAIFLDVPGITVQEAWPVFAETDLLMRSAGSPTLRVERIPVAPGVVRRIHTTVADDPTCYEEEHFQWEEPRWAGVRRFYRDGALAKLVLIFALHPVADGSRLELGFAAWAREPETRPVAEAVVRQLLPTALGALAPELRTMAARRPLRLRPALPPGVAANDPLLEGSLRTLIASGEDPDVSERFIAQLRQEHDQFLSHIEPLALAERWGVEPTTVLSVALRLARLGVLDSEWSVACPSCRGPKGTTGDVSRLTGDVHCEDCNISFGANPAENLQLTFRPSPAVRPLDVHWACVGGPARTPHVHAQGWLEPGEVLTLATGLAEADARATQGWRLRCPETEGTCDMTGASGRWRVSEEELTRSGEGTAVEVANATGRRVRIVLEDGGQSGRMLRADHVIETPRFRELFAADQWEFLCTMERGWRAEFGLARATFVTAPPSQRYDLLVIGCGPAGEAAALRAAALGARVAVVEARRSFGGSSGLPSKAFREAASKVLVWAQNKETDRGLGSVRTLFENRFAPYATYVSSLQALDVFKRLSRAGVDLFHGWATLVGGSAIELKRDDQSPVCLAAANVLIATGARPAAPEGYALDQKTVLDAVGMRQLRRLPESIIVVGAGVIALEYATILAALGTRVALIHRGPLAPFLDAELASALAERMRDAGIVIRADESIGHCELEASEEDPVRVTLGKSGERLRAQLLLHASGSLANTDGLGCDLAGVRLGRYGRVDVDEDLVTSNPRVFAAGDVVGPPGLASTAAHQGKVLADRLFGNGGARETAAASTYPTGLWTMPEVATVGASEEQLRADARTYVKGYGAFRDLPRGILSGDLQGWLKLLVEPDSGRVLGVHVIGQSACELIHYGAAMVRGGVSVAEVAQSVFAAATFHGIYEAAAEEALAKL